MNDSDAVRSALSDVIHTQRQIAQSLQALVRVGIVMNVLAILFMILLIAQFIVGIALQMHVVQQFQSGSSS